MVGLCNTSPPLFAQLFGAVYSSGNTVPHLNFFLLGLVVKHIYESVEFYVAFSFLLRSLQ